MPGYNNSIIDTQQAGIEISAIDNSAIQAYAVGGTLAISSGQQGVGSISIGVSLAENTITNSTAYSESSSLRSPKGNTTISADDTASLDTLAVAVAISIASGNSGQLALSGGGANASNVILGDVSSYTNNSSVTVGSIVEGETSNGNFRIRTNDAPTVLAEVGAGAAGAVSIGVALSSNLIGWSDQDTETRRAIKAYIDGGSTNVMGASSVEVIENATITSRIGAASLGFAYKTSERVALAGAGLNTTNKISNDVQAYIQNVPRGDENVKTFHVSGP